MKAAKTDLTTRRTPVDVKISYDENSLKESIVLANELRERNYTVISNPANKEMVDAQPSIYQIIMTQNEQVFVYNEVSYYFDSIQALLKLMNGAKGAVMN